jgi:hypothetical protein
MTINDAMVPLVAELEEHEILQPLSTRFTLADVWADLARIAGEELSAEAATVVGAALDVACDSLPVAVPVRGSYADYTREFLPVD